MTTQRYFNLEGKNIWNRYALSIISKHRMISLQNGQLTYCKKYSINKWLMAYFNIWLLHIFHRSRDTLKHHKTGFKGTYYKSLTKANKNSLRSDNRNITRSLSNLINICTSQEWKKTMKGIIKCWSNKITRQKDKTKNKSLTIVRFSQSTENFNIWHQTKQAN